MNIMKHLCYGYQDTQKISSYELLSGVSVTKIDTNITHCIFKLYWQLCHTLPGPAYKDVIEMRVFINFFLACIQTNIQNYLKKWSLNPIIHSSDMLLYCTLWIKQPPLSAHGHTEPKSSAQAWFSGQNVKCMYALMARQMSEPSYCKCMVPHHHWSRSGCVHQKAGLISWFEKYLHFTLRKIVFLIYVWF